jgi:cyclic pyranopterin phosphate synthase
MNGELLKNTKKRYAGIPRCYCRASICIALDVGSLMSEKLSHLDANGRPIMVDVSEKADTVREAIACAQVMMSPAAFAAARDGGPKGEVLRISEIAGIMAAKKTAELIPLCHPLPISKVSVAIEPRADGTGYSVEACVRTTGKTGVEMEALMAVSVAALTLYDMLKAVDKGIVITEQRLLKKSGGKSGDWVAESCG